ncbi:MAG: Rv3235 family protein [Rhodococcus sp. (in: high G+C Gram-positive bacteria)]
MGGHDHTCGSTRRLDRTRSGSPVSAPRPGPHSGRSGSVGARTTASEKRDALPIAAAGKHFADRALRLALEVIDRRRPASSLRAVLSPAVVGLLASLTTADVPGRHLGSAVVRTVHVRAVDGATGPLEIFGTYSRGDRVFAVAGRMELRRGKAGHAWTITGLRLS